MRLTRRGWLVGVAASAGAAILAACGETAIPTPTAGSAGATAPRPAATTGAAATGATTAPAPATMAATPVASAPVAVAMTGATAAAAPATVAPASGNTAATTAPAAATTAGAARGRVASQIDTAGIKRGGTVIVAAASDVTGFNPVTESNVVTNTFMPLLFDALTYNDPDTVQPTPNLATKWEVSPDNKTYTFTLKPGVKWHDGMPFTAEDVKFSYELYMNAETGSIRAAALSQLIAGIAVRDPQTVVFTLKDVSSSFLAIYMYGILPKHLLGGVAPKDFKTSAFNQSKPVGTGPFVFKEQKLGDRVVLTGNREYHRGPTALDQYIYKVVKDNTVTYQQMKTGELDFATVSADVADDAKKQPNLTVVDYDTFTMLLFGYNLDPVKGPEIFRDVRVRQALCYVQDRETIAQKVYNGYATVAVGTQPPLSWAYQPDKITAKYPYDPKRAESLLDEAGWRKGADGVRAKDGKKLAFTLSTISGSTTAAGHAQVVQEALKAVGVDMQLRFEESAAAVNRASKSFDYDMFHFGLSTSPDPDQTRYFASDQHGPGANYYGYSNPKVDDLFAQGSRTLDVEKRKAFYLEAQNLIVADMPVFITHFLKSIGAVNKRVKNLVPNAISTNFNAHQWYVTDGK